MGSPVFRIAKNNIMTLVFSYKLLLVIFVSCVMPLNTIYQLRYIGRWNDVTILDGVLYQFGLYTLHYLIFVPLCIFVVYDLVKPSLMDNFIFFRIGNRKKLFFSKMLSCAFASLFLLLMLIMTSLIVLSFNFQPGTHWGSSMLHAQSISGTLLNSSLFDCPPYLIMVYQLVLVLLSFIVSSWMLLFFMEVIKRKSFALVATMLVNFSVLILAKSSGADFVLLPCANTFLLNVDILKNGYFALARPVIYWVFIGGLLFTLNRIVVSRKDFLYDDAPEDES